MTDHVWHTVGLVNGPSMHTPHVLQQRTVYVPETDRYERVERHRLVSIWDLEGVE